MTKTTIAVFWVVTISIKKRKEFGHKPTRGTQAGWKKVRWWTRNGKGAHAVAGADLIKASLLPNANLGVRYSYTRVSSLRRAIKINTLTLLRNNPRPYRCRQAASHYRSDWNDSKRRSSRTRMTILCFISQHSTVPFIWWWQNNVVGNKLT